MNRITLALALGLALMAPAGCKIVKTAPAASADATDPDAQKIEGIVAETWEPKLLPLIAAEAVEAATLVPAISAGLDAAGSAHGHRGAGEGGSWTFAVTGQGVVTGGDRKSRAARLEVDVTGDGKADLSLQLGPVVKGTALRDIAPFYDFTDFRDQIQFAKLARALNDKASASLSLPDGDLIGKTVTFAGAFALHAASDPILVTPTALQVAP